MKCAKCNKNNEKWISGKTYEGIDEHHNPPTFMFKDKNDWIGKVLLLCRNCHKELHKEILKIMFKHSSLHKPNKSEYWTWIKITPINRDECRKEVFEFTKKWMKENE